jgi:hypothetical protein
MLTLLIMYIILAVLMILVSIPLIRGMIKPNLLYGFRFPQTLANTDIWYKVNAYGGRLLFGLGVVTALVDTALYFLGFDKDTYATLCAAVMLIGLFVTLGMTWSYMLSLRQPPNESH